MQNQVYSWKKIMEKEKDARTKANKHRKVKIFKWISSVFFVQRFAFRVALVVVWMNTHQRLLEKARCGVGKMMRSCSTYLPVRLWLRQQQTIDSRNATHRHSQRRQKTIAAQRVQRQATPKTSKRKKFPTNFNSPILNLLCFMPRNATSHKDFGSPNNIHRNISLSIQTKQETKNNK